MKQPDPDKVRQLGDTAARLARLKDEAGWADLRAIAERTQKRYWDDQTRRLRNGEQIDHHDTRAHQLAFDLVDYLLAHPEKAETTFKRALDRAERWGQIQEEAA